MKAHLGEIIDREVPVSVTYRGGYADTCTLVSDKDGDDRLGLVIKGTGAPFAEGDRLSISYDYISHIYTFETEVQGSRTADGEATLLSIARPRQILRLERRKSVRIEPEPDEPVVMTILCGDIKAVVKAVDISDRGASFLLPDTVARFAPGSTFSLVIDLPRFGAAEVSAVVRTVTEPLIPGPVRYGVQFDPAAEFDSPLAQYAHWRHIEIRGRGRGPTGGLPTKTVFLAFKESERGKRPFLCPAAPLHEMSDFYAFSEIVSADVIEYLEDDD